MTDLSKRLAVVFVFVIVYIFMIGFVIGWRSDHTFFLFCIGFLLVAHRTSHNVVLALSAFILFWISYDLMRVYPNYLFNPVHVIEPYQLELDLFGVNESGKRVILCEWFATRTSVFRSLFAGISYLLWVPGPIVYSLYLYRKDKNQMFDFSYAFLLTNFIGFIIYYIYPAAPPWYYLHYGVATDFNIPGSEGLLSHFDQIVGHPVFNSIYAKNANVFAAIPSLHASYPLISLFFAIRYRDKLFILFFAVLTIGIWFAAVYSQHHYVIDLLLGGLCALVSFFIIKTLSKNRVYNGFKKKLISRFLS